MQILISSGGPLHLNNERGEGRGELYCHPQAPLAVAVDSLGVDLAGGQHHRPRLSAASGAWGQGGSSQLYLLLSRDFSFTVDESDTLLLSLTEDSGKWLGLSMVTKQANT